MSVSKQKLQFWADRRYNVMFIGKHGVGKTAIVKELFNERYGKMGEDWLYYSASTMDPWVDFVGVPEKRITDGVAYLELVRPKVFALSKVKALFFDEFNRAPKKVLNAVMELIQFGSINGEKFENLELIWAAINPPQENEDELEYSVEKIDPAQMDRFHVQVDVAYTPSKIYFKNKYGDEKGQAAVDWWLALPAKNKELISPRRLDYVVDCYVNKGDINDIIPKGINAGQLISQLEMGSFVLKLDDLFKKQDKAEAKKQLLDHNFSAYAVKKIFNDKDRLKFFFPCLPEEIATKAMLSKTKNLDDVLANCEYKDIIPLIEEVYTSDKASTVFKNKMKKWMQSHNVTAPDEANLSNIMKHSTSRLCDNTNSRRSIIRELITAVSYLDGKDKMPDTINEDIKKVTQFLISAMARSHSGTIKKIRADGNFDMLIYTLYSKHYKFENCVKKLSKNFRAKYDSGIEVIQDIIDSTPVTISSKTNVYVGKQKQKQEWLDFVDDILNDGYNCPDTFDEIG